MVKLNGLVLSWLSENNPKRRARKTLQNEVLNLNLPERISPPVLVSDGSLSSML
jgi:hypothetical protein